MAYWSRITDSQSIFRYELEPKGKTHLFAAIRVIAALSRGTISRIWAKPNTSSAGNFPGYKSMSEEFLNFTPGPLSMRRKRVKLRTREAVKRRRAYKDRQPKKSRIRCARCNKRFIPKRVTKRFCCNSCRNLSNIAEHKLFNQYGLLAEWVRFPESIKKATGQLEYMRAELYKIRMGIRR